MMIRLENRIYNFSLIWNTISKVFYGVSNYEDIDKIYKKYLSKVINVKTQKEYYLILMEFINIFNDGHTDISIPKELMQKIGYLPFRLIFIEGQYYIYNTTDNLKDCYLKEIKTINGKDFNLLKKKCFRYIHSVNGVVYHSRMEKILPFFLKKKHNCMITTDGSQYTFDLIDEFLPRTQITLLSAKEGEIIEAKNVNAMSFNKNTLYIKLNSFNNSSMVNECCEIIKNSHFKNLILDIRDNEGGMTANAEKLANLFIEGEYSACSKYTRKSIGIELASASQYNLSQDKIAEWIANGITTQDKVEQSQRVLRGNVFEKYIDKFGKEKREIQKAKLFILTSRYTISAAEDFVAMFKTNHIATIIGDNTYGSTGTPYILRLDDGSSVRICSVYYRLLDGEEFINKGINPDIYLTNNIRDYRRGEDNTLNKVLDLINRKEKIHD